MKKLGIIISCNLHWAPYYNRYEKFLFENNIAFDLIQWNREGINENIKGELISYNLKDETNNGNIKKVFKFIKFSKFVKKVIKKNKYEKLVFLGTYAGMPAFLSKFLKKYYKGNYWIDLRDITYENYKFFYNLEKIAIENSYQTVISSPGFSQYLPKYNYSLIHNIDPNINTLFEKYNKISNDKIRISYIGNIGFWDACKEFIDLFANDDRYLLQFFGTGSDKVKVYCEKNKIHNTNFHGPFKREETVDFYNETDIVYNVYGNNNKNLCTALSNKLYYAIRFSLPILVSENTYMEKIAVENNIGISYKNNKDFPDELFNWYKNYNNKFSNSLWESIIRDDSESFEKFKKYILMK